MTKPIRIAREKANTHCGQVMNRLYGGQPNWDLSLKGTRLRQELQHAYVEGFYAGLELKKEEKD